jgi:hypothetical protein
MIIGLLAAKQYLDSTKDSFSGSGYTEESPAYAAGYKAGYILGMIFYVIFLIIYYYGAARLSYFYNMNNGNSSYAVFWSVLAFLFGDIYYPMYSYFLNPQSARGRNNIPVPTVM